jgi:hypothetical protein
MVGIVKKVTQQGSGIIAAANGSRVPFVLSDVMNQRTLKPGESGFFSSHRQGQYVCPEHNANAPIRLGIIGRCQSRPPTSEVHPQ